MVVKIYISGISGNKEVKKRQQRVLMILDSKNIKYEVIDITEPGKESDKEFMQNNSKSNGGTVSDPNPRSPLPPQVFNDDEYCGDYDQFDLANEVDTLEQFLKVEVPPEEPQNEQEKPLNGDLQHESKESSQERHTEEESPAADKASSREGTPSNTVKESSPDKEGSTEKEKSPEKVEPDREKSAEKEASPVKEDEIESTTHENDETVNENGKTSSREESEEKESEVAVKDPSSTLIESEQQAAAE